MTRANIQKCCSIGQAGERGTVHHTDAMSGDDKVLIDMVMMLTNSMCTW